MNKLLILAFLLALFSGFTASASVGAVPGSIDFGTVESGESLEQEIYVTTTVRDSFDLNPGFSSAGQNDIFDDSNRYEVSEEDISDWVEVGTTTVNGSTVEEFQLDDGSFVNSNGDFQLTIDVPGDAEPGYHHGTIHLNPQLSSDEQGQTASYNWGETVIAFRFRVEGNAERQLSVQDVRAFRQGEDSAVVELLVRNAGSLTVSTEGAGFDVYDQRRNQMTSLYATGGTKLAPGETKWLTASWNEDQEIDQGTYQVDGDVNYITGSAAASGSFSLPGINRVEVRPEDEEGDPETGDGVPLWFVIIVLSILGVLMWGFDIEPFWIVAILGVLGISAFILLSGVPNYILAILLIVVAVVIYGGM
jgi:hypothetical protein